MTTATKPPTLIDIDTRGLVPDSAELVELTAEVTRRCAAWHALTSELGELRSQREALARAIRDAETEADRRDARRELRALTADARDLPETYAVAADELARALDDWTTHLLSEVAAVDASDAREARHVTRDLLNKRRAVGLREGKAGVRRWVASQREIAAGVIA